MTWSSSAAITREPLQGIGLTVCQLCAVCSTSWTVITVSAVTVGFCVFCES